MWYEKSYSLRCSRPTHWSKPLTLYTEGLERQRRRQRSYSSWKDPICIICVELFWSKFNWTMYFLRCIRRQSCSGRFNFLHLSTLLRSDFSGSHAAKKTLPTCFVLSARTTNFFFFLRFFSWRMQTLQRARNVLRLNSQISQDGTFVHYLFFVLNIPLFTFSYRIFSRYLFVLTYFDSSRRHTNATTHATGTQIVRAKMTSLDAIFSRGNKSSSCSLARFCRRKDRNSTDRASRSWKIWARLI